MTLQTWNSIQDRRIQIVVPMSVFPKKAQFLWPMSKFINTALGFGADGIRFQPMRNYAAWQLFTGQLNNENLNGILCTEQSFRSERWPWQWLFHKNKKLALAAWLFMPYISDKFEDSLWGVRKLTQVMGKSLPITLYPAKRGQHQPTQLGYPHMLIQIAPEMLIDLGITKYADIPSILYNLKYTGVTLDLLHIRRSSDWLVLFEIILPYIQEVHIPLLRPDFSDYSQLIAHFWSDVKNNTSTSSMGYMLTRLISEGWGGNIVLEGESANIGEDVVKLKKYLASIERV